MTAVWEYGPDDPSELLVLLALADFANDKGECYPGVKTVADMARMSQRNCTRVIGKLCEEGFLTTDGNKGGRGKTTRYTVIPKPCQSVTLSGGNHDNTMTDGPLNHDTAMSWEPSRSKNHAPAARSSLDFWAEKLNGSAYVAPSAIKPELAREMLAAGLVTPEKLKERGIAA